ncbi:GNAT family N-acetyltransferase [Streptomyces sp. NPDC001848]|uniref:GNAT family N-acetyltransferase n=1 Tax=Streptomyces sp. NPDC001848 TaxID=3364618 RepID=UPI0036ADA68D
MRRQAATRRTALTVCTIADIAAGLLGLWILCLLTRTVTCRFAGRMSRLRIEKVDGDATVHDWQHVHNLVIPTHYRSLDEVRERSGHNVLEVAYLDDTLIGCTTVRPPTGETPVATVIARVLPDHRGQGFGAELYERGLAQARELGAEAIETVVLASNRDGLRFAQRRGFAVIDEYVLPGETIPWVELRLAADALSAAD